jgi:hypothetical protein
LTADKPTLAVGLAPDPPPDPSATFAPLMRAVNSLAVESYQRSPFDGVEGSPATLPTFKPAVVAFGAKVCLTPAVQVSDADTVFDVLSVLFVSVSAVARPTSVSVEVGNVKVPVLEICAIMGVVNVLFVSVCVAETVTIAAPLT